MTYPALTHGLYCIQKESRLSSTFPFFLQLFDGLLRHLLELQAQGMGDKVEIVTKNANGDMNLLASIMHHHYR